MVGHIDLPDEIRNNVENGGGTKVETKKVKKVFIINLQILGIFCLILPYSRLLVRTLNNLLNGVMWNLLRKHPKPKIGGLLR